MSSTIFFFFFIPLLALILLAINLLFAPHNPYQEKNSAFECGFTSFLGQNRTQFSISFFIFALLFLLFDLEILLVYPYLVSAYTNETYGLVIILIFLLALTLGFAFELGKKALSIDSRQTIKVNNIPKPHNLAVLPMKNKILPDKILFYFKLMSEKLTLSSLIVRLFVILPGIAFIKYVVYEGSLGFYTLWAIGSFVLLCESTLGVILNFNLNQLGININLHQFLFGCRKCMPIDDNKYESYANKPIVVQERSYSPPNTPLDESGLKQLENNLSKLPPELMLNIMNSFDFGDLRDLMYKHQEFMYYKTRSIHPDDVTKRTDEWFDVHRKAAWSRLVSKANQVDRSMYIFEKHVSNHHFEAFKKRVDHETRFSSRFYLFKAAYKNANGEVLPFYPMHFQNQTNLPNNITDYIKDVKYMDKIGYSEQLKKTS